MARSYKKKKETNKEIARERVLILFSKAEEAYKDSQGLANRYVKLARKIQMKYKIRMPSELKRKFCKHCLIFAVPSRNCRVRLQKGHIVYYCLECKKFTRFVHKGKKRTQKERASKS